MLCAQGFTNSAVLSAALDNTRTNLVITWSMSTTQGWVTLYSASALDQLGTNAQPVDLAQVPPSMQGQFTEPINPAAPSQFYKLLLEQWPSRGKALVWTNGPIDFDAMRATYGDITNNDQTDYEGAPPYTTNSTPMIFKQPVEVWIDSLGNYDTNGVLVGGNAGGLNGKYATSTFYSLNDPDDGFPPIPSFTSPSNDFRVNYLGDANVSEREAVIWSSQVQFYHDVNDYRNRFLNDSFIDSLNLPAYLAANLKIRQFRPDLNQYGTPGVQAKMVLNTEELYLLAGSQISPAGNLVQVPFRTRGPFASSESLPPLSFAYDSEDSIGEYSKVAAWWVEGTNCGFPYETSFPIQWQSNCLAAVAQGLFNEWEAYRYTGNHELCKYFDYAFRIWGGAPCGGTGVPCDKGENIRNVMMADVPSNTSGDGVFPFQQPDTFDYRYGPAGSLLAGMLFGAIFYDIANEAGLGVYKTDQIVWKTVSLITNNTQFELADFGAAVQQAARQLWPDPRPAYAGLSLYEQDLVDVLTSRGIPMNGVSDFHSNLPPVIGSYPASLEHTGYGFGSRHPDIQPSVNYYGNYNVSYNRYFDPASNATYIAYQFYKHSKYGPCDKLALTDGTFTVNQNAPYNWSYNNDGTFYGELTNRDLGNVVVFLPGASVEFLRSRQRCPNEATGFYAEDVQPFGFICVQSTPNGFSFTVSALSSNATFKTYQLSIVDPSTNTLGAATYNWTFTDYMGNTYPVTGAVVQYPAYIDEPFTISIDRIQGGVTNNLTLRERGNDLDRCGGNAFVRNLIP